MIIVESATALAVLLPVRRAVEQCAIQQLFICQLLVGVVDVVQQLQCVELYTLVPRAARLAVLNSVADILDGFHDDFPFFSCGEASSCAIITMLPRSFSTSEGVGQSPTGVIDFCDGLMLGYLGGLTSMRFFSPPFSSEVRGR